MPSRTAKAVVSGEPMTAGPGRGSEHAAPAERCAAGVAARAAVPPTEQARFEPSTSRPDSVGVLRRQAVSRVPELVPIRHGRMLASPFAFFRGAAAVMAADLASTPASGLRAQICGDAHLANFGMFGSAERRLVFDVNDFDETHPGPWEWDVKRLATSLEIAARENDLGRKKRRSIVLDTVLAYQRAMNGFAGIGELDVWYAHADVDELRDVLAGQLKKSRRKVLDSAVAKARSRDSKRSASKLTTLVDGRRRIRSEPPLLVPLREMAPDPGADAADPAADATNVEAVLRDLYGSYRRSLNADRRVLIDRFELVDVARKVVGVGSVGTRCWIVLLSGRDADDPLFLQIKEAQRLVIAEYGKIGPGRHRPSSEGQRVVNGQRLTQASSDILLGWQSADGIDGQRRDFYVRQLADWKGSVTFEDLLPSGMCAYGRLCGWTLARAHARSGDRFGIAGYLGDDTTFAHAVAEFAATYADQNERDFAALREAARKGEIAVEADPRRRR